MSGVVYLVGAGPGDPGLVTLRGAAVLARADVVFYDRLVNPAILELAPGAELVNVGKPPGTGASMQPGINDRLVAEARAGRTVVRLKGGDPFVFGRGGEEAAVLAEAGVRFEIVPGVTSAVAGPAYAGIAVTHRAASSWVAVATGHEDPGKDGSGLDWDALARAGTGVYLMGLQRLGDITAALIAAGGDPGEPAAVIASATLPSQRVVVSTLGGIAGEVSQAAIEPPALLVVGRVVEMSRSLDWFTRRPLHGRRVFVPRPRERASALAAALGEAGAEVLRYAAVRIEPPADTGPLREAVVRLGGFAWVVFTSVNAVDAVLRCIEESGGDARAFSHARIAAVGPGTESRLAEAGLRADLVPSRARGLGVAAEMPPPPHGASRGVLLPRSEQAASDLPDALRAAGWTVEEIHAYRTLPDPSSTEAGAAALRDGIDAVCFTSGSSVRGFVEAWGAPPDEARVCCIGPVTARAAAASGLRVDAVASEPTVDALVAAVIAAVRR